MNHILLGCFVFYEKLIRWSIHPKLRVLLLRIMGANIKENVRIYEVQFSGLLNGFKNITINQNSIVSQGCFFDMTGKTFIGERVTISPCCTFITHHDPGSMSGNKLSNIYNRVVGKIHIGNDSWIGTNTTILANVHIGNLTIIGANSLVLQDIPDKCIAYGNPAKIIRKVTF